MSTVLIMSESKKMDISESSDQSSPESTNTGHLILSNAEYEATGVDQFLDRNVSMTKNATNNHTLMYSPTASISPDFPDVIPRQAKRYNSYEKNFSPDAHSSMTEGDELLNKFKTDLPLWEYDEKLPDFPSSPSALKKSIQFEFPVEVTPHDALSDNENDKSVYEAHLSSNLQNVSLTMNEKEGNLNFLAHNKKSNKLRKIKVIQIDTSEDSDVSSVDTNPDSLKSEDVFNRDLENFDDKLDDFPSSPSALKKSRQFEFPVEVTTHDALSDNENDEAHLTSSLLNVSLTMNEKEGNPNFFAHSKKINKLRKIKVIEIETSEDSDVSSVDTNPDSLKSEDVFNEDLENDKLDEPARDSSGAQNVSRDFR